MAALPLRPFGQAKQLASAQGFGAMNFAPGFSGDKTDDQIDAAAKQGLHAAFDLGVTLVSTASFYGQHNINHRQIGKAIKGVPRDKVFITSKIGQVWGPKGITTDFSAEGMRADVEQSLKNLGVDYIDVLVLRGKDPSCPIADTIKILMEFVKEGKAKALGLCEVAPQDIEAAAAAAPGKIACLEQEWSLFSRDAEAEVIPTARRLGMAILAYSPLGRGILTGMVKKTEDAYQFAQGIPRFEQAALDQNNKLVERLAAIAARKGCTTSQLALAWLHGQGDDVFPIPGTKTPSRIKENVGAFQVMLTPEELKECEACVPEHEIAGKRWPEAMMNHLTFHGAKAAAEQAS